VIEAALRCYPKVIAYSERWISHYTHRIAYEKAMLGDSGGTVSDRTGPERGGACQCWASPRCGWCYIEKVNKVSVTVLDNYGNRDTNFNRTIPFNKLTAVMTAAQVQQQRDAGCLIVTEDKTGFFLSGVRQTPEGKTSSASPCSEDSEQKLRALWNSQGVLKEEQDQLIAEVAEKAQPGAQIGPFTHL
jgi:hypothetical protein